MNAERSRSTFAAPRWLSVFLLLTVFFLPLHFHAVSAAASQITKECSCLHGSRAQADLAGASSPGMPSPVVGAVESFEQVGCVSRSIRIPSSRAPPLSVYR